MSEIVEVDELDFFTSDYLEHEEGDKPVVSNAYDQVFLASNRIPKGIKDLILSDEKDIDKKLLLEKPLLQHVIEKPFWKNNKLNVEIYGTVCLAHDRAFMDNVIAHGSMIDNASNYTLRQVIEAPFFGMQDVDWDAYPYPEKINAPLSNQGVYFHIDTKTLANALNNKLQKSFRQRIQERMRRLRTMELKLTPEVDGVLQEHKSRVFNFLGPDHHLLLDVSKMKGTDFNSDTFTDIIVNVNEQYLHSLQDDGIITRRRMKHVYPELIGTNNIDDFYRMLDSHKRAFIHNKYLSDLIVTYFDGKIFNGGTNRSTKLRALYSQALEHSTLIEKHFGIRLVKVNRRSAIGKTSYDYQMIHLNTENKRKNV